LIESKLGSNNRLAEACQNIELFLEEKLIKCERRTKETLINNPLVKEEYFTV